METIFEENKKYKLIIDRDGYELIFTASKVKIFGALITFYDRANKQFIFPIESLRQADEVIK